MRTLICFLLFTFWTSLLHAQLSDDEAKQFYRDAEEQYEAGNFYKCYQMCNELVVKMGKPNPRILYLDLKAIYNNLEKKNDKSEYTLKQSYQNFVRFSGYADDFFAASDKNSYPADKYKEMLEIQKYFQEKVKAYAYEKDRKPADAVAFLNECAQKFGMKSRADFRKYKYGDCYTTFILDSNVLRVDVFANLLDGSEARFNQAGRERILIDLSKVWIDYVNYEYHGNSISYNKFFWSEFGNTTMIKSEEERANRDAARYNFANNHFYDKDEDAPMIVGRKIYVEGKAKYDDVLWYYGYEYSKKLKYDEEKFEKEIARYGYEKRAVGFYIYSFFDQSIDEFKDGNYRKRILDAFEFLIEYFGGGTPVETKLEVKNKF